MNKNKQNDKDQQAYLKVSKGFYRRWQNLRLDVDGGMWNSREQEEIIKNKA